MAKNIDNYLETVEGVFSDSQKSVLRQDGKFIIPDYQRAYN